MAKRKGAKRTGPAGALIAAIPGPDYLGGVVLVALGAFVLLQATVGQLPRRILAWIEWVAGTDVDSPTSSDGTDFQTRPAPPASSRPGSVLV